MSASLQRNLGIATVLVLVAAVVGYVKWPNGTTLPDGLASGNGRIEATEVDVSTKLAGRLSEVRVREGDMVDNGATLALLDDRTLQAQLKAAQAELMRATQDKAYAEALVTQRRSELTLAQKQLDRARKLVKQGNISSEQLDRDQNAQISAEAALKAAEIGVQERIAAITVAEAQVEGIQSNLDDTELKAPIGGRVLYRLAEPGEVLGAGGKVLTLLDLEDVYMTIFLPTADASRLAIGDEARIILDAVPDYVIPASVSYVSPQAQFTPKMVETRVEREKLMFRVKVRIDPALLRQYADQVKVGVPGEAYVRTHADTQWPTHLQVKLPQ